MESRGAALAAVAEALLPPLDPPTATDDSAAALYRHSGASPDVVAKVLETVEARLPPEARRELYLLLRLLGSRLGCLLLLGRQSFGGGWLPSSFADLPLPQREAVLLSWSSSPDARMRKAFKALKSLVMSVQFTHLTPGGNSELLAAMGYPVTDPERPPAPAPAAAAAEAAVAAALVDLSGCDGSPGSAAAAGASLAAKGMRVVWPGDFGSPAVQRERPHLAVECDVVVVGSGAGGGVAAANLAAAGLRVVVLEKAGFVGAAGMTLQEGEAFQSMYEQGGILASEDGTMTVLAGATLGGGTRINWCASFRTPPHVRKEWAEEHGLSDFASERYDAALDAVCSRLSVHTGFKHSAMCSALRSGLEAVGAHAGEVPRNCLNADCGGHCCLGCARGYKQDSVNTYLSDACKSGARIITGAWAERVLLEPTKGGCKGGQGPAKRAVGVLVLAGSGAAPLKIAIQAPTVISAAGSIHSPALLLRSRITCRGNVGANLRLHPCTCVVGVFPPSSPAGAQPCSGDMEDLGACPGSSAAPQAAAPAEPPSQRRLHMAPAGGGGGGGGGSIRCWEGTLMSIFSNTVGDWEGGGYGSLLYTPAVHPGLFAAASPWVGGADYKELLLQYPNCCVVLVLVRDSGSGRVVIDRSGRPRIHYSLAPKDEESMLKGMELGLRSMAAAGAQGVMTMLNSPGGRFSFEPAAEATTAAASSSPGAAKGAAAGEGSAQPAAAAGQDSGSGQDSGGGGAAGAAAGPADFEAFLADVAQTGVVPLQMPLFCAHQMGTCRLGTDPASSVLDPQGQCWEAEGLYCCDGSTFPTPTGVNPMISIEAISYMLSKQLAERLAPERAGAGAEGGGGTEAASKL